jgi:hypothetical protein
MFPAHQFSVGLDDSAPASDFVICFEVLIHQPDLSAYNQVIDFATRRTTQTLIISGYAAETEAIRTNSMVFFHEPLADSLAATGRFSSIREIGRHTDVVIYRCDV